jgi:hypothetical protein
MLAPLLLVLAFQAADRGSPAALERLGRLEHAAICEASGIAASRRHPGVFWVHNDSGNAPALYAVARNGALVREYAVAAPNLDWEDIAADDAGHLYIGDIGNNAQVLRVRVIYRVDEPDPARRSEGPLPLGGAWYYTFGPEGRFDAEGLFIDRGRAVLVAKRLDGRPADLFAVPLDAPAPLTAPTVVQRLGTLEQFVEPATGAALAPDGRRLAVCSPVLVRVYVRPALASDDWKLAATVRFDADGVEAVTWDGDDLILASEGRGLYRIAAAAWRRGSPGPAAGNLDH